MIGCPPLSDMKGPKFPCTMADESGCVEGVLCCSKVRNTREKDNLLLLDATPVATHLYDPERGVIACNQETLRLFGVDSIAAYNRALDSLSPSCQPDGTRSSGSMQAHVRQALAGEQVRFDWTFCTPGGTPIPMRVMLVPVEFGGRACLAAYMQDLRELRLMETGLRQSTNELVRGNELLHAVNTVARILLLEEGSTFDETVNSALALLGSVADVHRVYIWQNHVGDDGRLYCSQTYEWLRGAEALKGPLSRNISYDDVLPSWRQAFERGACVSSLVRDMTLAERQQLEPQGIVSILVHPILLGSDVWGFIGLDDCERERVWTSSEEATLNACGVLIAASMEKHLVAQALTRAKEQAEQATMARGDFLARMSHEIRTPMNAILGLAYLCLQTDLSDPQRNYLSKIQTSAKNLLGIINDILDFSKIEASKLDIVKDPFEVRQLVEGVLAMFDAKAREKGLDLLGRVDGSVPAEVVGDALRVHQVLLNLCSNAIKFTEQGEVEVAVTSVMTDPQSCLLRFAVRDTGPGLTQEEQRRLFQPFSQADESVAHRHGGTGLGLAISRQLVELMGGSIELQSTRGVGSVFTFSLPCELVEKSAAVSNEVFGAAEKTEAALVDDPDAASFLKDLRVLLVEDNEINQLIAVSLLEQVGMNVTVASNGREACEQVASTPFDVVLMDIQMPEMDGLEATRLIRSRPATAEQPPIIAMTAHAMDRDKEQALGAGMNDYISKPFDPPRLMEVLRKWVVRRDCQGNAD